MCRKDRGFRCLVSEVLYTGEKGVHNHFKLYDVQSKSHILSLAVLLSTLNLEVCREAGPPSPLLTAPVKETRGV